MLIVRLFAPENVITVLFSHPGNVQQHRDLYRGTRRRGRGAQPSRGSRPRNVLLAAALIAVIGELYGDQFQTLVLAGQPERLGDWRRGLQDALGLSREDFGPNSGIVLFERGDALVERADRLEERGEVPLILIDASEQVVDIPVLQFPLWLACGAGPGQPGTIGAPPAWAPAPASGRRCRTSSRAPRRPRGGLRRVESSRWQRGGLLHP